MAFETLRSLPPFRWLPFFGSERPPTVAVLRLHGVIGPSSRFRGGLNIAALAGEIEKAFAVPGLSAVALLINSPGGSPVQSDLVFRRIRALADEKKIPVLAFAEDVAASGGYWLTLAGDEVFVNENSIIGSIGVISSGFGFVEAMNKLGIERRLYTSGDRKSMLDPFEPQKEQDIERIKGLQKDIHDSFKRLVTERRGERLKATQKRLFSGEFWTGRQAVELGLADALGDLRTITRARFGSKVRFKVIGTKPGLLSYFTRGDSRSDGPLALPSGADFAEGLISAAETRLIWQRFGL